MPDKKFVKYTVPAVMLLVMCLQFVLIRTANISPWKGGGFGMFSTINTPISHIVRVFTIKEGKKIPVLIPESLKAYEKRMRHLGIEYNANALKQAIQKQRWISQDSVITISATRDSIPGVKMDTIVIELWRYQFDIQTKRYYSVFVEAF